VTSPDVLLRHDQVSGVEVAVVESIVPGKYRITRWVAPNLACEDLYYRSEALQPDGSYRVTAEAKTTHLELSEPASSWFDAGSQYDETKPSIAHEKLARFLNIQLSDKEKADLDRQLKAKDLLHTERTAK
jgi:hypothetical protein